MADWIYESHGKLPMAFLFVPESIHPHLNPLPSRERKIKERVFIGKERSNEINEMKEV